MSKNQPFTVLVEGNIGAGKTTFLNHFKKFNDVCLHTEPVDKWRDVNGVNLLDLMYKDPSKWAMPFQTYVTLTMLEVHLQATDKPVKLMERSLYSAKHCFVEAMYLNGTLHKGMYYIMNEWHKHIKETQDFKVDLIVYLRTTPEIVYERMRARGRFEENAVSLNYLRQLHELHENWLIHGRKERPAPVLILNADLDLDGIEAEYRRSEDSILQPVLNNESICNAASSNGASSSGSSIILPQ